MSDLRQQLTRSLAETGAHIRAVPLRTVSYAAFKACEGTTWRTYELGDLAAATLDQAKTEAVTSYALNHKERLILRETGDRGVVFHIFAVRRGSRGQPVYRDHVTRLVYQHYLDHLLTVDAGVLLP